MAAYPAETSLTHFRIIRPTAKVIQRHIEVIGEGAYHKQTRLFVAVFQVTDRGLGRRDGSAELLHCKAVV